MDTAVVAQWPDSGRLRERVEVHQGRCDIVRPIRGDQRAVASRVPLVCEENCVTITGVGKLNGTQVEK